MSWVESIRMIDAMKRPKNFCYIIQKAVMVVVRGIS